MEKLTTAHVRACLALETYQDIFEPITLQDILEPITLKHVTHTRERGITTRVGGCRVRILEFLRKDIDLPITYHAHITPATGKVSFYEEDRVISSLVRKINKICLGGRCSK